MASLSLSVCGSASNRLCLCACVWLCTVARIPLSLARCPCPISDTYAALATPTASPWSANRLSRRTRQSRNGAGGVCWLTSLHTLPSLPYSNTEYIACSPPPPHTTANPLPPPPPHFPFLVMLVCVFCACSPFLSCAFPRVVASARTPPSPTSLRSQPFTASATSRFLHPLASPAQAVCSPAPLAIFSFCKAYTRTCTPQAAPVPHSLFRYPSFFLFSSVIDVVFFPFFRVLRFMPTGPYFSRSRLRKPALSCNRQAAREVYSAPMRAGRPPRHLAMPSLEWSLFLFLRFFRISTHFARATVGLCDSVLM